MKREFFNMEQGSPEWHAARCGVLTASEIKNFITPKKKEITKNYENSAFFFNKVAEKLTGTIGDVFISNDMIRGQDDEIVARALYSKHYAPVEQVGFVKLTGENFELGFSPDGIVKDDKKTIEIKSKKRELHLQVLMSGVVPDEHMAQIQAGMFVCNAESADFICYCAGMPMVVINVKPDYEYQAQIVDLAINFQQKLNEAIKKYHAIVTRNNYIPTENRIDTANYYSDIMGE